jgi:hypothetical protein
MYSWSVRGTLALSIRAIDTLQYFMEVVELPTALQVPKNVEVNQTSRSEGKGCLL